MASKGRLSLKSLVKKNAAEKEAPKTNVTPKEPKVEETAEPTLESKVSLTQCLELGFKPVAHTETQCLQCNAQVEAELKKGAEVEPKNESVAHKLFWVCSNCHNKVGAKTRGRIKEGGLVYFAPKGNIPSAEVQKIRYEVYQAINDFGEKYGIDHFKINRALNRKLKTDKNYTHLIARIDSKEDAQKILDILESKLDVFISRNAKKAYAGRSKMLNKYSSQVNVYIHDVSKFLEVDVDDVLKAISDDEKPFDVSKIQTRDGMLEANKKIKAFYRKEKRKREDVK